MGLFPDEFEIDGVTHAERNFDEDVTVNSACLNDEFVEHSRRFAYWSTLYELAAASEARLKTVMEQTYAHVDAMVRRDATASAIKLTERMVTNSVITHELYKGVQEEFQDAQLTTHLLKVARDAMIQRKDMLVGLGANFRAEAASDPSILQKQYKSNQ